MATSGAPPAQEPRLLWNQESVKDVAESVGISHLNEEALRTLSQDVEYRIGQVIVESLRFMRAACRTTLTVQDVSQALKVLDVEPLYGYESTRPLRFGEASLGPGQPLFYLEDEEVDFEKLINAPLPKVPRDASFTAHWLAVEGVQPSIPQNPTTAEARSQELVPKGPGANAALAAVAGNDNVAFKPAVKHVISKELVLYFDKVQAAILDDNPDEEVARLREAALESVRSDPGLHQLLPYFVNFISNNVTHRMDDVFVLRQMMELTGAIIQNPSLFIDPYASGLSAPVLTCLLGRKLGGGGGGSSSNSEGSDTVKEQYELRQLAASLLGRIAQNYSKASNQLRPKLTRTCLKNFLDPAKPEPVLYGAIAGLAAAGGPEAVRMLVLPNLRHFDALILQPLRDRGAEGSIDFETLVQGGIVRAIQTLSAAGSGGGGGSSNSSLLQQNGVNGVSSDEEKAQLVEYLGPILGTRIANLNDHRLNREVLEARQME